jgi:hypothetical protein
MTQPRTAGMPGMPSIIRDTKLGKKVSSTSPGFMKLVAESRGIVRDTPVMDGVIRNTKVGAKLTNVPELHKIHNRGKTQPRTMGQVPYAGKFY